MPEYWDAGRSESEVHHISINAALGQHRPLRNTRPNIENRRTTKRRSIPPQTGPTLKKIFDGIEKIRRRAKKLKGLSVKDLIEDDRR
jgi:hypothetical protein